MRTADDAPSNATGVPGQRTVTIRFGGIEMVLDAAGVLVLPAFATLVVSDLHLEKGSSGRNGYVPPLDSLDTIHRLGACIAKHRPERVICLGDSFHDGSAGERMREGDRAALQSLCVSVPHWVWVSGNHDPDLPDFCAGERAERFEIEGVALSHMPDGESRGPRIIGHYHPKAAVWTGKYRFSGPCFCVSGRLLMLPAFGAYTGGLRCTDPAIQSLHAETPRIYMLHAERLWRLA